MFFPGANAISAFVANPSLWTQQGPACQKFGFQATVCAFQQRKVPGQLQIWFLNLTKLITEFFFREFFECQ
jgi:hypothetical protein